MKKTILVIIAAIAAFRGISAATTSSFSNLTSSDFERLRKFWKNKLPEGTDLSDANLKRVFAKWGHIVAKGDIISQEDLERVRTAFSENGDQRR